MLVELLVIVVFVIPSSVVLVLVVVTVGAVVANGNTVAHRRFSFGLLGPFGSLFRCIPTSRQ